MSLGKPVGGALVASELSTGTVELIKALIAQSEKRLDAMERDIRREIKGDLAEKVGKTRYFEVSTREGGDSAVRPLLWGWKREEVIQLVKWAAIGLGLIGIGGGEGFLRAIFDILRVIAGP